MPLTSGQLLTSLRLLTGLGEEVEEVMTVVGNKVNEQASTSPKKFTVPNTSKEVLKANANRVGTEWVNQSVNSIWLELGGAAKENEGIFLAASGGTWNGMVGPMVWTGAVFAIAPAGNSILTVVEC